MTKKKSGAFVTTLQPSKEHREVKEQEHEWDSGTVNCGTLAHSVVYDVCMYVCMYVCICICICMYACRM